MVVAKCFEVKPLLRARRAAVLEVSCNTDGRCAVRVKRNAHQYTEKCHARCHASNGRLDGIADARFATNAGTSYAALTGMMLRVGVLVVCACAGQTSQVTPAAPTKPVVLEVVANEPRDLETLARWVNEIPAASDPQRRVAAVVDLLADYFAKSDPVTSRGLKQAAEDLVQRRNGDAAIVRSALATALDSLATDMQLPADSRSRSEYMTARRMRLQIAKDTSIEQQVVPITQSLRAITNLVAISRREDAPFPPSHQDIDVGYDQAAFAAQLREASRAVHELAAIRDWKAAAKAAGDALNVLADTIATAPLDVDPERWRLLVREARYRGSELVLAAEGLDRSEDVKAGLTACVDAFRYVQLEGNARELSVLAKDSVSQIGGLRLFTLQRAAVQEAFRTTVDALYLVETSRNARSGQGQHATRAAR